MAVLINVKGYLIVLLLVACNLIHAQGEFASIRKNINVLAKGLNHDLNKTKDTLKISSSDKFFRIYTIGDNNGAVDQYLNTNTFEVPLRSFERGKYVFIVDQSKVKIVFTIFVLNGKDLLPGEFLYSRHVASNLDEVDGPKDEAAIESDVAAIESDATKVESVVTTIKSDVASNEFDATTIEPDISSNEFDTTTIEPDVASIESDIAAIESDETIIESVKATIESWDLLREVAKLSKTHKRTAFNLLNPRSNNNRNNKLAKGGKLNERTKKLKIPVKNLNSYNLTDFNRYGLQTREEARKIMAIERQKLRDSIKKKDNE